MVGRIALLEHIVWRGVVIEFFMVDIHRVGTRPLGSETTGITRIRSKGAAVPVV